MCGKYTECHVVLHHVAGHSIFPKTSEVWRCEEVGRDFGSLAGTLFPVKRIFSGEPCKGIRPVVYLGYSECLSLWWNHGRKERLLGTRNGVRRNAARWLGLLGLLLMLVGCRGPVEPRQAPTPTPDDLTRYILATERYTSYSAIVYVNDMSADDGIRILRALQAIEPPEELRELHEQAIKAYRGIYEGKLLLPGADSELRAEAYFMIEWGIGLLLDYREQLNNRSYAGRD